ncbi:MAG: hypothetical protein LCH67_08220 [Bacteroidetes bacterium]|nr:hypothetical protein [Bacteroidota bacterium]
MKQNNLYIPIGCILPFKGVNIFSLTIFQEKNNSDRKFKQIIENGKITDFEDITDKIELEIIYSKDISTTAKIGDEKLFSYLYFFKGKQEVFIGTRCQIIENIDRFYENSDLTVKGRSILQKFEGGIDKLASNYLPINRKNEEITNFDITKYLTEGEINNSILENSVQNSLLWFYFLALKYNLITYWKKELELLNIKYFDFYYFNKEEWNQIISNSKHGGIIFLNSFKNSNIEVDVNSEHKLNALESKVYE